MLADGKISDAEAEIINREAKRLHLSAEDVQVLIEQARRERQLAADLSSLPLHTIAARPEHAVERYKTLLSEIRQLGLLTDSGRFEEAARSADRLTDSEWQIWRQITAVAPGAALYPQADPAQKSDQDAQADPARSAAS